MIRRTPLPRLPRVLAAIVLASAAVVLVNVVLVSTVAAPRAAATTTSDAGEPSRPQATVPHDLTFIAMMVPHHERAIEMAKVAEKRAGNGTVRALAVRIHQAQARDAMAMRNWLKRHGGKPMKPSTAVRAMERRDLELLRGATGHHVDALFLVMMRHHHAQALSLAEDELRHGRDAFALKMARTTKTEQAKEIAAMNKLLASIHAMHRDIAA